MTTLARPQTAESSHFYWPNSGEPCYEVPRADGQGMRKTTLADAKKMGLVPSVTNVISLLRAPALEAWKQEQVALAVLTTPRLKNEADDAFVKRVLHEECHQDQESQKARDRGSQIHRAIEDLFQGREIDAEIEPWVRPAFGEVSKMGELTCTEKTLANASFGGMIDLVQQVSAGWLITDWKTSKKLPTKQAYPDHALQAAAYAKLWYDLGMPEDPWKIITQNVYISTADPGKFVLHQHSDWFETYAEGFAPLVQHWRWSVGM